MEHSKNEFRSKINNMNDEGLQQLVIELENEKRKLEYEMRIKEGTSVLTRNYPLQPKTMPFGNLKKIKKNIARVKTLMASRGVPND